MIKSVICGVALLGLAFSSQVAYGEAASGLWSCTVVDVNRPRILVCPAGDAPSLTVQGLEFDTLVIDLASNAPLAGYSKEDIFFVIVEGGKMCDTPSNGAIHPDTDTDVDGRATYTSAMPAGGHGEGYVVISGGSVSDTCPPVAPLLTPRFVSPDLNGDRIVSIADIGEFAIDYSGVYNERSDFNSDGVLNINDLTIMMDHIGHQCQ